MSSHTVTFTAEQFERIRRSLPLLDYALPHAISSWLAGRVEHATRQDAQEAETRQAIEEHLGPVRGDWIMPGTVSMLARIVALVRKGKGVEAAAWAEHLKFLREPSGTVPNVSGDRPDEWTLNAPAQGDFNDAVVWVQRESALSRLAPSVCLSVAEKPENATAILTPEQAREVALQLLRFAASAEGAAQSKPLPTGDGWWWGRWPHRAGGGHLEAVPVFVGANMQAQCVAHGMRRAHPVEDLLWLPDPTDPSRAARCIAPGEPWDGSP